MANKQVVLNDVVLLWPRLTPEGDRYKNRSVKLILEPDSLADKTATAAFDAVKKEEGWVGDKAFIKVDKQSLRDGDLFVSSTTGQVLPGMSGKRGISANNKSVMPPRAFRARDNTLIDPASLKTGNKANVIVSFWTFVYEGTRMVNCQIDAVQFLEQGEPLIAGGDGIAEEVLDAAFKDLPPLEPVEMNPDELG